MRERVELVRGRFVVDSVPARGTSIKVTVPLAGEPLAGGPLAGGPLAGEPLAGEP
jgi:hypothetical protein